MFAWRRAGPMLFALLSVVLLVADRSAARAEEPAPGAANPDLCQRAKFRVVVDVGHTVDVPGAMSARGIPEYAFNLQLAQQVKQTLADAGFGETVLLITATAPWRGLFERAARANAMHADLFIAIHHDSVPDNLLQTWQYAGQDQHYNDDYPGYAIFISNDNPHRAEQPAVRQISRPGAAVARLAVHAALHTAADGTSPPRARRRQGRRLSL